MRNLLKASGAVAEPRYSRNPMFGSATFVFTEVGELLSVFLTSFNK